MWSILENLAETVDIKWVIFFATSINIVSFLVILAYLFLLYSQPELFVDFATKARILARMNENADEEDEKQEQKSEVDESQSTDSDDRSESYTVNKGKKPVQGDAKKKKISKK